MEVINCDELFNTISNLTPTEYNNKYNELINIYPNNKDIFFYFGIFQAVSSSSSS